MASKKEIKVLTLQDLIAKKIEKDNKQPKFKDIEIKSLGGYLKFEKPSNEDALECMDQVAKDTNSINTTEIYNAYVKLIYNCCPVLRDKELQETYGVKDFFSIVEKVLDLGEVLSVGNELLEMCGLKDVDIKN